jgi:hypothetical protein
LRRPAEMQIAGVHTVRQAVEKALGE